MQTDDYENSSEDKTPQLDEPIQIFIGGLAPQVTEDVLRNYFSEYGELGECRLVVDKHSNKSRGFGFVSFVDYDCSQEVLNMRHSINGKEVECKAALSKQDSNQRVCDEKSKKIFVGGIPLYLTEEELKSFFRKFGDIKTCRIIYKHESNVSRGFGFVVFKHKSAADEVIAKREEHFINGKWIDCKSAILRQEIEQNPILAEQIASSKKASRKSPSPKKKMPSSPPNRSPNRNQEVHSYPKPNNSRLEPSYKQNVNYAYEDESDPYFYGYGQEKDLQQQAPDHFYGSYKYPQQYDNYGRNPRYNQVRDQGRYRQQPPPQKMYNHMAVPVERFSPDRYAALHLPGYYYGSYPEMHSPTQMQHQPMHGPYPPPGMVYPAEYRHAHIDPMRHIEHYGTVQSTPPVPVIQHFSPPRRIPNPNPELIPEDLEEKEEDVPTPKNFQDQAIRLNLLNMKDDPCPPNKNQMEPSKTLSPDRKPYTIFEGPHDPSTYDRNTGFFTPHSGMIRIKDTEVNSSRNSPQRMEYKKYYSPTQKSRSNFTSKLFEMTKALQQESTDHYPGLHVKPAK